MRDQIYEVFLRRQLEDGMALAGNSDVLDLTPLPDGDPPFRYIAHFEGCRGLVRDEGGQIVEFEKFMVGIWFPDDYLRRVNIPQVLTYLGPHPHLGIPTFAPRFCARTSSRAPLWLTFSMPATKSGPGTCSPRATKA